MLAMSARKIARRGIAMILSLIFILILTPDCMIIKARAESDHKLIAITFDDGPSNNTPVLLDGLEERGAVATFFMCGMNGSHGVVKHADLLDRMYSLGCQLANHSYRHPNFTKISTDQMQSELGGVEPYIYGAVGEEYLEVVRIPGGSNTERIRATVAHPMITWNVDPFDWRDRNEEIVYQRIMERAVDGGIILLHDLYPTSIAAGLRAIDSLREQGYEFVTVSELFRRRGVYLENHVVYSGAPANGTDLGPYNGPSMTVSVEPGSGNTLVSIQDPEENITSIHYTTDGSAPTLRSPLYTGPVAVEGDTTIRAAGFDRFATRTQINEKLIHAGTAAPRIESVAKGKINLSCATDGASIYYTTDGSDPRLSGEKYTGAIAPGNITQAVAVVPGRARSDVMKIIKTSDGSLFRDIDPDAWYFHALDQVVKSGWMGSVGDYLFAPDNAVTRAALVSILYRLEKNPSVKNITHNFQDVPEDSWYAAAVAWASANGIVKGRSDTKFDPSGIITRQQAATILYRYAEFSNRMGNGSGSLYSYSDENIVAPYARAGMEWCESNGLLSDGVPEGVLDPDGRLTRAQCACMIYKLSEIQ